MSRLALSSKLGQPPNYVQKVETGIRGIDVVGVVRFLQAVGADPHEELRDFLVRLGIQPTS